MRVIHWGVVVEELSNIVVITRRSFEKTEEQVAKVNKKVQKIVRVGGGDNVRRKRLLEIDDLTRPLLFIKYDTI